MKHYCSILFLLIWLSGHSQVRSLPQDVIKSINLRLEEGLNPGIVVGIIDAEGPRYFSYGLTKEGGRKVNEHSIYEIGSISKVFTATLLADMMLKGEVNIDDPIEKYIPSHVTLPRYDNGPITLGHLSDHTSSLPRLPNNFNPADNSNPYADYTVDLMYAFLSGCSPERPVGSEYEYSNLAVGLLGHILSLKAGKSYEELMLQKIALPLQMHETRVSFNKEMIKNLAPGHYQGNVVPNWDLPALAGAGGIRSSVYDMLKFLSAHMNLQDTPLKNAALLTQQPRHNKAGDVRVGLGWHIINSTEGDIVTHAGATGGYTAFAGFLKDKNLGVVVLSNSNESIEDLGLHILDPDIPLKVITRHVATVLKDIIDKEGTDNLILTYQKLKKEFPNKYDFSEMGINTLGYYYLNRKKLKEAQSVFLLNINEYPHSSNVYDSYGEALMEEGQTALAIDNYKKSLELNPANINAVEMLKKMGVEVELPDVKVSTAILQTYVGVYEIMKDFTITVTLEGDRLLAQATGQLAYEIFPKSETEFYYKVVDAQIVFNTDEKGQTGSLTLHQGGRVIEARKL